MSIKCSACGGETKEKSITTRFGPTVIGECIGGCKNEKGYALGTFAPKKKQAVPPGAVVKSPNIGATSDILKELQEIKAILLKIAFRNDKPAPEKEVDDIDNELEPDEDTPF